MMVYLQEMTSNSEEIRAIQAEKNAANFTSKLPILSYFLHILLIAVTFVATTETNSSCVKAPDE